MLVQCFIAIKSIGKSSEALVSHQFFAGIIFVEVIYQVIANVMTHFMRIDKSNGIIGSQPCEGIILIKVLVVPFAGGELFGVIGPESPGLIEPDQGSSFYFLLTMVIETDKLCYTSFFKMQERVLCFRYSEYIPYKLKCLCTVARTKDGFKLGSLVLSIAGKKQEKEAGK